ncbi:MAG: GTPase HflX [Fimbriimonadales bacterium]
MSRASYETKQATPRAFLVFVNSDAEEDEYSESELNSLCEAAGVGVVGSIRQRVDQPSTASYIGKGKLEELWAGVQDTSSDLVVFDCELSSIQLRNVSDRLKVRVIDRTQLILDIFALRAHTREGVLQVELAQLTYMMPKITAVYTEFERQKGGIGMRGPGETQLESDRQKIRVKIKQLKEELEDVRKARGRQRASRRKHPFPFACLVGYTSAGKSSIMNRLSGSEVFADPMLFATLDPTTRKVELPHGYAVFLTDTVGFVRNLPTGLVAAFRATLEEVTDADFLIHIVDSSSANWEAQQEAVLQTLVSLEADNKPMLTVFNKLDLVKEKAELREQMNLNDPAVAMSAKTGEGADALCDAVAQMIRSLLTPVVATIPYDKSGLVQECYDFGRVLDVQHEADGIHLSAEVTSAMASKLKPYVKQP